MGSFKEALMFVKKIGLNDLSFSELQIIADNYILINSKIEARLENDARFEGTIIPNFDIEKEVVAEFLRIEKEQKKSR